MTEALTIYIGYDAREHDAYEVCRASLLEHATVPLHIVKLDQAMLRAAGWYRRGVWQDGAQRVDVSDGRPFSTDFAFTRFMVPALNLYQGWALFCDCDFLFTADIAGLFSLCDPQYAVQCVKHDHAPAETQKMGGIAQGAYRRKNWSSLVLWNAAHPANKYLTGYMVNEQPGRALHAFDWLPDDLIGDLPLTWNWLAGVSDPLDPKVYLRGKTPEQIAEFNRRLALPYGIHFTLGVPSMPGHENTPYAELWRAARSSLVATEQAA